MSEALLESRLRSLPLVARGKVRDNYAVGDDRLLMVASDRLSAFDVVMGEPIPGNITAREGLEQPVYYWDPVIAPSGMQVYSGGAFPAWRGNIFIGGLASQRLVRLVIKDNRVTGEEHLLTDRRQRVRDVRQGPDGMLYVVTDESSGELWKISPKR